MPCLNSNMRILTKMVADGKSENMFDLPHSAPRDFIMVSTPDFAHALGTTKPDPFKRQIVVTEQGKNIYLIGIVGCDCKENSTALCFNHPFPHIQCQEGCTLSKANG